MARAAALRVPVRQPIVAYGATSGVQASVPARPRSRKGTVDTVDEHGALARTVAEAVGTQVLAAGVQKLLSAPGGPAMSQEEIAAVEAAIDRQHRKKPAASSRHEKEADREVGALRSEVAAIIPLLPEEARCAMLGGELGMRQVPDPERQQAQLERKLTARAGNCGERIARARRLLCRIRKYAAVHLRLPPEERDHACFPMSAALAHEIIHMAHARSAADGKAPKASVGDGVRDDFIAASKVMGWPIEVDKVGWAAAAPKAASTARAKAGTLPIAAKCQLESFAGGGLPASLRGTPRAACQFYSRSLLCGAIDQGVRVDEGVRVEMQPDEAEPEDVMTGVAYMGKDGAPIEVSSAAEGFLGIYEWWPEHLRDVLALGQLFPEWERPWGSKGSILLAGPLTTFVNSKQRMRESFKALLQLPPLSYTDVELKDMNIQGHSAHVSGPEWSRCIGYAPSIPDGHGGIVELPGQLVLWFTADYADTLGLWMRDAGAKREASVAEVAAGAPAGQARREAAIASLPGRRSQQGSMRVYYGQGGSTGTRFGQKFKLLSARQRLARIIRAVIGTRDWRHLPRGQADLKLLRSQLAPPVP